MALRHWPLVVLFLSSAVVPRCWAAYWVDPTGVRVEGPASLNRYPSQTPADVAARVPRVITSAADLAPGAAAGIATDSAYEVGVGSGSSRVVVRGMRDITAKGVARAVLPFIRRAGPVGVAVTAWEGAGIVYDLVNGVPKKIAPGPDAPPCGGCAQVGQACNFQGHIGYTAVKWSHEHPRCETLWMERNCDCGPHGTSSGLPYTTAFGYVWDYSGMDDIILGGCTTEAGGVDYGKIWMDCGRGAVPPILVLEQWRLGEERTATDQDLARAAEGAAQSDHAQDVVDAMSGVAGGPEALQAEAGDVQASGAASVPGTSETTRSQTAQGVTVTTVTNNITFTYAGNTANGAVTTQTQTTNPDGSSSTTTKTETGNRTAVDGIQPIGGQTSSDLCAAHPDASACAPLDGVEDQALPTQPVQVSFRKEISAAGVCPSPTTIHLLMFGDMSFEWDAICRFATAVRPVIIIIATLSALLMIFLSFKRGV